MGLLTDVLAALDRFPEWKKMREAPARVDELELRVAELERRIQGVPGKDCPSCGKPAFRIENSRREAGFFGETMGAIEDRWKCQECGYTRVKPA